MMIMPACCSSHLARHYDDYKRRAFTWMMKIVIGSFGLYLDGFPPSRMPPCDATRDFAEVAAGFAEAVLVTIEATMLAMIVP